MATTGGAPIRIVRIKIEEVRSAAIAVEALDVTFTEALAVVVAVARAVEHTRSRAVALEAHLLARHVRSAVVAVCTSFAVVARRVATTVLADSASSVLVVSIETEAETIDGRVVDAVGTVTVTVAS